MLKCLDQKQNVTLMILAPGAVLWFRQRWNSWPRPVEKVCRHRLWLAPPSASPSPPPGHHWRRWPGTPLSSRIEHASWNTHNDSLIGFSRSSLILVYYSAVTGDNQCYTVLSPNQPGQWVIETEIYILQEFISIIFPSHF